MPLTTPHLHRPATPHPPLLPFPHAVLLATRHHLPPHICAIKQVLPGLCAAPPRRRRAAPWVWCLPETICSHLLPPPHCACVFATSPAYMATVCRAASTPSAARTPTLTALLITHLYKTAHTRCRHSDNCSEAYGDSFVPEPVSVVAERCSYTVDYHFACRPAATYLRHLPAPPAFNAHLPYLHAHGTCMLLHFTRPFLVTLRQRRCGGGVVTGYSSW